MIELQYYPIDGAQEIRENSRKALRLKGIFPRTTLAKRRLESYSGFPPPQIKEKWTAQ
jgi:hypothetical protein